MDAHAAIYKATRDGGAVSAAEIRKGSKLSEEDVDTGIADAEARLWLQRDDSGKNPKWSLTDEGRISLSARYPDA